MPPPLLKFEAVTKVFGRITALDGLDLEIPAGGVFGIVGPDGAGKSTLIRVAMGLTAPDSGRVTSPGRDYTRSLRAAFGYLPQRFSLYDTLSALENVRLFGELYGIPGKSAYDRARTMLLRTGLWEFRDRLARNLSGGMRQKLALCVAAAHEPRALFLDEPTTGVDPVARREFWSLLYELGAEGVTVAVTTPYMDEAELCDRLAFLYGGRVLRDGTPQDLLAGYPHTVVEIETPPGGEEALSRVLASCEGVLDVNMFGTYFHAETKDAASFIAELQGRAAAARLRPPRAAVTEPGMEDLFVHLLRGQAARGGGNG